jgi:hypothetical protein
MGRAANALAVEEYEALRWLMQTHTELVARLDGQSVNDMLEVATYIFDASATPIQLQWGVAAGCIEVQNTAASLVTVMAGGSNSNTAPINGHGVYPIEAHTRRTVAVASRQVTLYGTAGASVTIQAFTSALRPGTA